MKTRESCKKDNLSSHLSKGRMDIKKEGPVDVVASHLSKVGLVPAETPKRVIMKKLFTPRFQK